MNVKPFERVFLVAYDDGNGHYACAFSSREKADAFVEKSGGIVIDTGVDAHAPVEVVENPWGLSDG